MAAKRMEAEAKLAEQARKAVEIEAAAKKAKKKAPKNDFFYEEAAVNGDSAVNGNAKVNGDSAVNGKAHPWLSLSPSAFKRLTAKDLSEFLEERVSAS